MKISFLRAGAIGGAVLGMATSLHVQAQVMIMEDGTIFDPSFYEEQLAEKGAASVGTSTEELYRNYQLYGQGDGYAAFDESEVNGILLEEMTSYAQAYQRILESEYGPGYLTLTSTVYDTDELTIWDTEYAVSEETAMELAEAIALFESDGYDIGFVLVDLTTGDAISYRAGVEVYSASVIKAPYIFSLLQSGIEPTNDMYLAGNQSDNSAYVRIRTKYGNDVFAAWLEGTGVPQSQSKSRYITTTPLDIARMFYKGSTLLLGDEEYSDWARNTFTDSLNSAAALTIGQEKTVYSKAGWIAATGSYKSNSYTNAAIVDGDYPYVVAMMSNTPGSKGLTLAQTLLPVLDKIHDEMVVPEVALSSETEALTDFALAAAAAAEEAEQEKE